MKTSKLKNVAWVFFALALTTTTVFGQGWKNGNRNQNQSKGTCLNTISGLTEDQKTQIASMDENHYQAMDELRAKRRSTTDAVAKSEIRTEMLKSVEAHRNGVKSLLNADQQKQYEQLFASAATGRNQNVGKGRGNASVRGRGQGKGNASSGNNQGYGRSNRGSNQGGRGNCRNWN